MSNDIDAAEVIRLFKEQKGGKNKYPPPPFIQQNNPNPVMRETKRPESIGSIGILLIATGPYIKFVKPLWDSIEKHFLPNWTKTPIVFTDHEEADLPLGAQHILIPSIGWPEVVLKRYAYISGLDYSFFEYLINFDVDLIIKTDITDTEFLADTIGVMSPLNINRDPKELPFFERRRESRCFISPEDSKISYSASITGGRTDKYIELLEQVQALIDRDLQNGITPVGFEESALNRVFLDDPPARTLSPEYLWLEGTRLEPEYRTCRITSLRKPDLDKLK